MCNGPTYRFSLEVDNVFTDVTPVYDDGLTLITAKAQGEEYYRTTLSGQLSFVRADYDLIASYTIEDTINFNMEKWDGSEWQTYFSGYFTKADCRFELDECGKGVCKVEVTPRDFYDKILGGMDKEFDLIELAPPTTPVQIVRQPIVQIYAYGASYLNNYLNGTWWEQEVVTPITSDSTLEDDYFFTRAGEVVFIPGSSSGIDPDVSGLYIRTSPGVLVFDREDDEYRLQYKTSSPLLVEIIHKATTAQVYVGISGEAMFAGAPGGGFSQDAFNGGAVLTSTIDPTSQVQPVATSFFVRLLTNQATVGGSPTEDIPASDIVPSNENYTKVIGIAADNFFVSDDNSTTATRWGKFDTGALHFGGNYFGRPAPSGATRIYPVSSSNWLYCSYWFEFDATINGLQESAADEITLLDAYKLSDALDAVLSALNPGVSHAESGTYSNFLYGESNAIRGALRYPIISPKSNVILGEYDKPAQKAPIRLSELLQLLWVVFRCKWHIDTSGNFIVEHIAYYDNGGTYSGTEVSTDLTTLLDPQTGKSWEWGRTAWGYEKETMPERIEYGWMDDTSLPFDGYPIQIRSNFVQKGNIDSQQAARFTADVDFILSQGADISKDGFVVMDAEEAGGVYSLPFVNITLPNGDEYKVQNGYVAYTWLHPNYHRYSLPASLITLNEEDSTALSVTRRKIQDVEYPAVTIDSYLALVTTGLGDGKVLEFREDVNGEFVRVKIAHETT